MFVSLITSLPVLASFVPRNESFGSVESPSPEIAELTSFENQLFNVPEYENILDLARLDAEAAYRESIELDDQIKARIRTLTPEHRAVYKTDIAATENLSLTPIFVTLNSYFERILDADRITPRDIQTLRRLVDQADRLSRRITVFERLDDQIRRLRLVKMLRRDVEELAKGTGDGRHTPRLTQSAAPSPALLPPTPAPHLSVSLSDPQFDTQLDRAIMEDEQ